MPTAAPKVPSRACPQLAPALPQGPASMVLGSGASPDRKHCLPGGQTPLGGLRGAGRRLQNALHGVRCPVPTPAWPWGEPPSDPPVKTSGGSQDQVYSPQPHISGAPFVPLPSLSCKISYGNWIPERLVGTLNVSRSQHPRSSEPPNPRSWEEPWGEEKPQPEDPRPPPWLALCLSAKKMTVAVIRVGVSARPGKRQWGD